MLECNSAETGVGPSIASGNHICKGNIALFPAPPTNTNAAPHVNAEAPRNVEAAAALNSFDSGEVNLSINVEKSNVPPLNDNIRIPIKNPRSANLVTINAFFHSSTALGL